MVSELVSQFFLWSPEYVGKKECSGSVSTIHLDSKDTLPFWLCSNSLVRLPMSPLQAVLLSNGGVQCSVFHRESFSRETHYRRIVHVRAPVHGYVELPGPLLFALEERRYTIPNGDIPFMKELLSEARFL